MTEPLHCRECDDITCAGFATPRATPEPAPALRPDRVATEAERRAALVKIRADLADIRRKQQEGQK